MVDATPQATDTLQKVLEGTERYRGRARSVATITATAAGALAAGLVLNATPGLPGPAKVFGFASMALLIVSTVIFVIASLVHPRTVTPGNRLWWRKVFRLWESSYIADEEASQSSLLKQSDAILKRILLTMDVGLWLAGGAVLALIGALAINATAVPLRYTVDVTIVGDQPGFSSCKILPRTFKATVSKSDLERDVPELPLTVPGSLCADQGSAPTVIFIDRSRITMSMNEGQ